MPGSDFSRPYISGDGYSPSRCGPRPHCVIGRTRDLPVPAQGASAHARVSDHAGPSGHSRSRTRPCCLPRSETRRHPGLHFFRGSMAGLHAPLPTLRCHPRGRQRTARGRGGFATPSSWRTCTPYSLPVSRRTQIKCKLLQPSSSAMSAKPEDDGVQLAQTAFIWLTLAAATHGGLPSRACRREFVDEATGPSFLRHAAGPAGCDRPDGYNQAANNWTAVPKNWNALRIQWEYSHAANAVVTFAALVCVVIAVLRQPSQAR